MFQRASPARLGETQESSLDGIRWLEIRLKITTIDAFEFKYLGTRLMEPFSNTFAEKIAHLCYRKFERLPKSGKPIIGSQWTSLAAIIKHEVGLDFQILSLATGSKCIGKSKLSLHGDVINDSHAEVSELICFISCTVRDIRLRQLPTNKVTQQTCSRGCNSNNVLIFYATKCETFLGAG